VRTGGGPGEPPGAWGPTVRGGTRFVWLRRLGVVAAVVVIAGVTALASVGFLVVRKAEAGVTRVPVAALETQEPGGALNVLVVGSDSREGLSDAQRRELSLGSFDGERSDTMFLITVTPDRTGVNILSFPRDLLVRMDGRRFKLTETFFRGPDGVVGVINENFDVPVNHYVEVSIGGFIGTVEVLGAVEVCLDEPLRDRRSGADFEAGCQTMTPEQALSYVRSRRGNRGDFERIERQQTFLKAMLKEMLSRDLVTDVPRLLRVVEEVASNVSTDEELGVAKMRSLAEDLRGLADGQIPMTFVPGYTQTIDGKSYVIAYRPGADALFQAIRDGEVLAPRGTPEQRADTRVALWTGGRLGAAGIVEGTLNWGGFRAYPAGRGPVDAESTTTVYVVPGHEEEAAWVAALLGAPTLALPPDTAPPEGAEVVVATGDDALTSVETLEETDG
jgi:LCP family protein required for cell wall assembly